VVPSDGLPARSGRSDAAPNFQTASSAKGDLPDIDIETQSSVPFDGRFLRPGNLVGTPNPQMPLIDALCTRRTSRSYAETPVDDATFEWLVGHAMHAPSACNEQQWKVILIDDPAIIQEMYERGSASFLSRTRQCFLVCYNAQSDNREWLDHIQSGAAFISIFQLLAHSIGIGSCWIGHLPNKAEMKRLLRIHRHYEPVALVSFGYYRDKVRTMPRKRDAARIIQRNQFMSEGLVFNNSRRTLFRTVARYIYYKIPTPIRRKLKPYTTKFEKKIYYETFD
jgi:nitroreductase